MVKTAQKRFILITLSILFAVFSVIFAVMWGISRTSFAHETTISLSEVEREYTVSGEIRFFKAAAIIEISAGGNKNVVNGEKTLPSETVDSVFDIVSSRQDEISGNVKNAYFSVKREGAWRKVYIVDMSEEVARFNSVLLKTLILLLSVFIVLGIIVFILSQKVFEPIKRMLNKQKQFISDASHELRTPVAIISANTDVIQNEENKTYTRVIKKQVERLDFLVNDLLTLARLDEGNVKTVVETFDLSDEVLQTVLPFDAVAFENGKTLNCDIDENVIYKGAKNDVKKILNILLDNAVKYSSEKGEIRVSLKKHGLKTVLSIYNDGSLVPDGDADKIFERFYREDSARSRTLGGNGLGLAIAKSIAAANKWHIEAKSEYKKSMTISLTL